jgi:hypothetical protein
VLVEVLLKAKFIGWVLHAARGLGSLRETEHFETKTPFKAISWLLSIVFMVLEPLSDTGRFFPSVFVDFLKCHLKLRPFYNVLLYGFGIL